MADHTSRLIVQLIDRVSAPAGKAAVALSRLTAAANGPASVVGRLNAAISRNNAAIGELQSRMGVAIGAGVGLGMALKSAISPAMNFETLLEDLGQKADLSGAALSAVGRQIQEIARATNTSGMAMGQAVDAVIGLGLNAPDALAIAPAIGKVATAYRAAADDVGRAGVAVLQNLKVPAEQVMAAFDAMALSGKEGAFELRDMAQYFPSLAAMAQNLGIQGVAGVADLAAALQITRRGAGDASEAATNLMNVLQKISAPATRKNFKKFGINITKEVEAGIKAGVSPIETLAIQAKKAMEKGAKMPDLFEDRQVQLGLLALIQNLEDYRRIRAEALKASGMVEEDFQRRLKTSQAAVARFQASVENLKIAVGTALLPALVRLTDALGPFAHRLADFAEKNPKLIGAVTALAAGFVALKVAAIGAGLAGRFALGGMLLAAKPIVALISILGRAGKAAAGAIALQRALGAMSGARMGLFAVMATGLRGIVQALPLIGGIAAGVSAPVVALVGALAAGGFLLWKYWDRVSSVFSGVAKRIGEELAPAFSGLQPILQPVLDWLGNAASWLGERLGGLGAWVSSLLSPERLDASGKAGWEQWGYGLADGLVNSVKTRVGELVAWFAGLPGRIMAAVGSIDLGALIKWPSMPSWLGGGGASAPRHGAHGEALPARSAGGPVTRGRAYLVGEKRPEIFTPNQDGYVHARVGSGGKASITVSQTFNVSGTTDPETFVDRVKRAVQSDVRDALRGVMADTGLRLT